MRTLVTIALVLGCASALAAEMEMFQYSGAKVGQWTPPEPPAKESPHLQGSVPAPADERVGGSMRKLLQTEGGKVPHNWFGQGRFKAPLYSIATGKEECDVCKAMIAAGVPSVTGADPAAPAEGEGSAAAKKNLCADIAQPFKEMCMGFQQYLESCPSFVHNICHEDLGGSERLRSPCPEHLKCYYCLRINPLYCV